mmetsp:Transcript_99209/g.283831  ORF Transcript_99209/g.283831 Transcript_99209/m.283831 type:complete len:286 (-) Transcript_99209:1867-2724(-)
MIGQHIVCVEHGLAATKRHHGSKHTLTSGKSDQGLYHKAPYQHSECGVPISQVPNRKVLNPHRHRRTQVEVGEQHRHRHCARAQLTQRLLLEGAHVWRQCHSQCRPLLGQHLRVNIRRRKVAAHDLVHNVRLVLQLDVHVHDHLNLRDDPAEWATREQHVQLHVAVASWCLGLSTVPVLGPRIWQHALHDLLHVEQPFRIWQLVRASEHVDHVEGAQDLLLEPLEVEFLLVLERFGHDAGEPLHAWSRMELSLVAEAAHLCIVCCCILLMHANHPHCDQPHPKLQ